MGDATKFYTISTQTINAHRTEFLLAMRILFQALAVTRLENRKIWNSRLYELLMLLGKVALNFTAYTKFQWSV